MIRLKLFAPLAALCLSLFCLPAPVQANLLTNGDFSSGSSGWGLSGSAAVTDTAGLPASYNNRWDLSSWQNSMNGNFILMEGGGGLGTSLELADVRALQPFSLYMDYSIAWELVNPVGSLNYGYFYVELMGRNAANGINYPLMPFSSEIDWISSAEITKNVLTGTLFVPNLSLGVEGLFDRLTVSLLMVNPNQSLFQIAGFDNVRLESAVSSVPAPEPSTILLLGVALMGTVIVAGKQKRRATRS
ncbi:PEP-CTERM sorting domain-containing protein [Pelotalea chapellei]|uniref:PEP-CTERM sorting domain-containing protein n=1 Tax=Pelotalea chapellei TaxID=44671 RepID=A0ABS5U851_9BACT|nr:PEP-CTERM sorting domain-containing protein [Pelotalea chapellei]MBT1071824.1 PEP-CTERM sorting domain-containing protein [Pelotalea chapellei]